MEEESGSSKDEEASTDIELSELEQKQEEIDKTLSILCCGPIGSGKYTLLNGLLGEGKWSENFNVGGALVQELTFTRNGIQVTVWETPASSINDDEYLREIGEKCGNFDLFLYCIDSAEIWATDLFDEKSSLVKFTEFFGIKRLWTNAVVVLTQANGIVAHYKEERFLDSKFNVEKAFEARITKWKDIVHHRLLKLGYEKAKEVPVLPAGVAHLPSLPGYPLWLSKLFIKVTERMKSEARVAYLRLSNDRVQQAYKNLTAIAELRIEDQPFIVPDPPRFSCTLQ